MNGTNLTRDLSDSANATTLFLERDSSRRRSALPAVLLEKIPQRLRLLAIVYGVSAAGYELVSHAWPFGLYLDFNRYCLGSVAIVLLSVAVYLGARRRNASAERLYSLGLVYQVVVCFIVACLEVGGMFTGRGISFSLSFSPTWVSFLVVGFPLFFPSPPGRLLVVSIVSASAAPLCIIGTGIIAYRQFAPPELLWALGAPSFLAAGIGVLGGLVVFRLGQALNDARELGSYRLIDLLGRGGMGEVWRAKHRMLARPAAIKLISPSLLRDLRPEDRRSALNRFEREAQITASLSSPNTVELYDYGITDDGRLYYVMELLDGFDLDALVRRFGPLAPERVIFLLSQICSSLADAHESGLVHRDIKPANLFVCRKGTECDFVKVLDFGLVGFREDWRDHGVAAATPKGIRGTPAFLAPESVSGTNVDGRADLYALGCVGYWLLTGEPPFQGETAVAVISHHLETKPERPSSRSEVAIPRDLEDVIMSCLEKDPGCRPQTADETAQKLASCSGAGTWTAERRREWWQRFVPKASPF